MTNEIPHAAQTSLLAQASMAIRKDSISQLEETTVAGEAARCHKEDLIGRIISNRYKIIDEIGTGGMGKVYRVEHLLIGKTQAIKLLHKHLSSNSHSIQRFQTEAKAASSLRHDNLLTVTDFGLTESDQPFIVMDYIRGRSLSEILKEQGPLAIPSFIEIFMQVCKGLAHAHEKLVIHRDLKPSNIMIDEGDGSSALKVRIVDFGIAKILPNEEGVAQHLTQTGELFGSPLYMSPEQCHAGNIDSRSDIYSLGCAMFEALTGVPPLKGASVVETLLLHMRENAPLLSEACPGKEFPIELERIVAKALEKDREERYQSVQELLDELARFRFHQNLPAAARATLTRQEDGVSRSKQKGNPALTATLSKSIGPLGPKGKAIAISSLVVISVAVAAISFSRLDASHDPKPVNQSASKSVNQQLDRASELTALAWAKLESAGPAPAEAYAQNALEIRRRLAPNSELMAESLNQVAYLVQEQASSADGTTDDGKLAMAEHMYKQAMAMSSNSKPFLIETGLAKYKRNLADLYMMQGRFTEAQSVLADVLDRYGKDLNSLDARDADNAGLMKQLAALSWGLNLDEQAAVLEVKMRVPSANVSDNLRIEDHPEFAGDWNLPASLDGYSFGIDLKRTAMNRLVGAFSYATADASRCDNDDEMTGTFSGPVAEITWTSGWSSEKGRAKLVRVNDYLVWHWTKGAQGALLPLTEVLVKSKGI